MRFACTVPLFAVAAILHAENCTLKGVAVSEDGMPAPGLEVSAGSFSVFHGSMPRSTKTGKDGTFSFAALPCGKYTVNVMGFDPDAQLPRFVTVDIKKQPLIQLIPVQVVGGLSIAQAKSLAKAGLRAFVISGNMGLPDGNARYNLPPAEIQRLVAGFIAEVSGG